jgi:hypothetical protein
MLPLLALLSCDVASVDDTGAADTDTCDLVVSTSIPDGADEVPGNQPVVATLSVPDPSATLTGSLPGVTTTSADGLALTWTPAPPIDPLTDVTLSLSTCAGASELSYRTADLGGPLDAGIDLAATGYRFDLATGTILKPATGAALLSLLSDTGTELLLGLAPAPGTGETLALGYRVAVVADGAQDPCSRTLDLAGGTLDRGWFAFGPSVATFEVYDTPVVLQDLAFGGAIAADGSRADAAWLRGWIEVEALAVAYAEGDVTAACEFFGSAGAACEPCPDGEGQCLALEIAGLSGTATGTPVEAVTEACPQ